MSVMFYVEVNVPPVCSILSFFFDRCAIVRSLEDESAYPLCIQVKIFMIIGKRITSGESTSEWTRADLLLFTILRRK